MIVVVKKKRSSSLESRFLQIIQSWQCWPICQICVLIGMNCAWVIIKLYINEFFLKNFWMTVFFLNRSQIRGWRTCWFFSKESNVFFKLSEEIERKAPGNLQKILSFFMWYIISEPLESCHIWFERKDRITVELIRLCLSKEHIGVYPKCFHWVTGIHDNRFLAELL